MTAPGQQPPQGPQQPPQPPPPGAFDPNDPAYQQAIQVGPGWAGLINPVVGVVKYLSQYEQASGSGKFSIDPAEITPLKQQWQHCIDILTAARDKAEALTSVKGPGDEDASNNMADRANASGKAYLEHNRELIAYCQAEMDKLDKALQAYQQNEDQHRQNLSQHGRS